MSDQPSILIKNATLWAAAGDAVESDAAILVESGRIVRTGRFTAPADVVIDAGGALAMPGFVQSHVHLCQTLFRGAAEDRALLPWLRERIWPLEAAHDEASLGASARLACAEMIRGGTTAFFSFETVRGTGAVLEAVSGTGLMGIVSHCLMDETGGYAPLAVPLEDSLAECELLRRRLEGQTRLRLAVAPRFALGCSAANLRGAAEYARDRGLRLHTHSSEQAAEVELVRRSTGMNNVEYLHSVGLSGPDVALAHCVHVTNDERRRLAETGTHVVHCPSANLKLGSGLAPVAELLERGVNVALGADGAACNNRLDMFAELRLAGLLQNVRRGPGAMSASDLVRMATTGGARAMGWEDELGELRPGRRANLILLNLDRIESQPPAAPATTVVYACDARAVDLTMVDGRILCKDGELTTIDEDALRAEVRREQSKLFQRAGLT